MMETESASWFHFQKYYCPSAAKVLRTFCFFICMSLLPSLRPLAEEQAQQRLQAEEAEEQYQTVLRMLNATTRKTQKKE